MLKSPVKALFLHVDGSQDIGDLLQIAKVEGNKIFGRKVTVLNIIFCPNPHGYVAVVQASGCGNMNG